MQHTALQHNPQLETPKRSLDLMNFNQKNLKLINIKLSKGTVGREEDKLKQLSMEANSVGQSSLGKKPLVPWDE